MIAEGHSAWGRWMQLEGLEVAVPFKQWLPQRRAGLGDCLGFLHLIEFSCFSHQSVYADGFSLFWGFSFLEIINMVINISS